MPSPTKFLELKRIFKVLHGPNGCLWDKKQTHRTLIKYLKEETGEFIESVKSNNCLQVKEELGDLLLQVMFHSQIAAKEGKFDIEDVVCGLIKKLKRRHPHVFGKTKVASIKEIKANWDKIKLLEKTKTK